MASSSKPSPQKQNQQLPQETRDWLELPFDVMANILSRLGVDILESAQKVCTVWRKICKDPAMWRVIYMDILKMCKAWMDIYTNLYLGRDAWALILLSAYRACMKMCKNVVDRSQGQLVDNELLCYVAERSGQLRRLQIAHCFLYTTESWGEALQKFPLLEELCLYTTPISNEEIEVVRHCFPMLTTLKVNFYANDDWYKYRKSSLSDEIAIFISQNLHELKNLELIGSDMTHIGLMAILDGCRQLESLDLRKSFRVLFNEELGKRCSEQIKYLKMPSDILDLDYCDYSINTNASYDDYDYYTGDFYECAYRNGDFDYDNEEYDDPSYYQY